MENLCICLHGIIKESMSKPQAHRELFIGLDDLEGLILTLKTEGYRFTLPGDAGEGDPPVCCFTFDDGYYNNRYFIEIAEKYEIPFIFFLNSYNVTHAVPFIWDIWEATRAERWPVSSVNYRMLYESLNPDERALLNNDTHRPFTLEELATFADHPLVHLAPHGHTHQPLVGEYFEQANAELDENLAFLEKYKGASKEDFSLPCGLYTKKLIKILLTRFTRVYTIDGGGFSPQKRVINRISLIHPDFGGPLRGQITKSFSTKARLLRKALKMRYTSRLFSRL